mmetsp:Transcript_27494/g.93867  ORF Transcript_27494/g.93867 Transcript_27494/m.93867 type:complete len:218 (+) Transcript_27494:115-768(+)
MAQGKLWGTAMLLASLAPGVVLIACRGIAGNLLASALRLVGSDGEGGVKEAIICLAATPLLYSTVWTFPGMFCRLCGRAIRPVLAMEGIFMIAKACQLWAHLVTLDLSSWRLDTPRVCAALLLGSVGQILNLSVYKTIGRKGVYYGIRLGEPVPWVEGWPFNALPHPQYHGSVMSGVALCALLASPTTSGHYTAIAVSQVVFYVIMAMVEAHVPALG